MDKEPDYRFSLANERTFLAWIRTALAVLAGGMVFFQFSVGIHPQWLVAVVATSLSVAAGVGSAAAYFKWRANQVAMSRDQPLPSSVLLPATAAFAASVCGVAILLLLWQA